jgi:hypothetical protein
MEMAGPVIPFTIGLCLGSTGRVAMVVVAAVFAVATVIVVFAGYAFHSASVMTRVRVRRPVGSISVAAFAATSSTFILHPK